MMAKFRITGPDGKSYQVEAPETATDDEVMAYVQSQMDTMSEPKPTQLESLGRGALQGVTFGLSDEAYGVGAGVVNKLSGGGYWDGYTQGRDGVRAANDRAQEENPGSFFAGELTGGVALPFGAARAGVRGAQSVNSSLKARSVASAKEGAAYGAAYGFGKGEGDVVDQGLSVAGGAAGGGAIGGAIPGAIAVGSAALRAPAQMARVATSPRQVAAEKMVEAFGRDEGSAVIRGGSNPVATAASRLKGQSAAGDTSMMLADMGGENTRNLVRAAVNMPNAQAERFNQVLNRRQAVEGRRLSDVLQKTLAGGKEFSQSLDSLVSSRAQNAKPAFDTAYNAALTPKASVDLSIFFKERGYARRLLEKTQESVQGMTGRDIQTLRPWELVHRVKMEINREIGRVKRGQSDGVANWTVRDLTELNRDLGKIISTNNGKLGGALQKYSDESSMIQALEDGSEDFFKLSPEELARKIRNLAKDEADLYRVGAARAQIEKIRQGDVMRDRTKSLYGSDDIGLRLKAVFPDGPERGQFMRAINNARKMAATRRAAQGNSTTAKQLTQAQEAGKAAKTVADVAGAVSGKPGAIINALETGYNFASGITPGVAAEILKLSMARPGAQVSAKSTQAIQEAFARSQARRARQGRLSDALVPAPGLLSAEFSSNQGR